MNGRRKRSAPRVDLWHWLFDSAATIAGIGLQWDGSKIWPADPHRIGEAIEKIERAWAVRRDPATAIQLATMYDHANRHQDALTVLRDAFRSNPRHPLVRYHAAMTLLRHGAIGDVRDFFESVSTVDPEEAFARFVNTLLERYESWVGQLTARIGQERTDLTPFVISCPVWGTTHASYFVRYLCATFLSENNFPQLAKRHTVHLVVFTTTEIEADLRSTPSFARLSEHATVHFMHYTDSLANYEALMNAHYGQEKMAYSGESLASYYARSCKFALMSSAHYAALAAGRATAALVSCQVADLVLNDGALLRMAERMAEGSDAVLVHTFAMDGKALRPVLDRTFRREDGALAMPSDDCASLLMDHVHQRNFAGPAYALDQPIKILWRVGEKGILVHANHYHPICLRPNAFEHSLTLTVDPVDSRFMYRSSLQLDRIHLVQDASIVGFSVDDDPLLDASAGASGTHSTYDLALWLWGYWGRFRAALFRSPLRFGEGASTADWERMEKEASAMIDAIVGRAEQLEEARLAGGSWRLPPDRAARTD